MPDPYGMAQRAVADLKSAILMLLAERGPLRNVDIGRSLGIYHGHEGHEGHVPRVLLSILQAEGLVEQDDGQDKSWHLVAD